jgi:hypothetical protein
VSSLYSRILRREQHRSRSLAVSVVLALFIVGLVYAGIELVLAALERGPLLVSPRNAVHWVNASSSVALVVAGAVVVVGLVLLIIAVTPGRRARHAIPDDRLAVIVDDGALAGALARDARLAADVAANRVRADVSARRARVFITPTSGIAVDQSVIRAAVEGVLATLAPKPAVRASVTVEQHSEVGS